jgi:tetratricopeptide (TPR) repeat protein
MATTADTLTLGRQRHQAGDLAGAVEAYRRVVVAQPDHAEALALLALACHQRGELAEAEGWYRRALAARAADPEIHFRLGMVLASLGRPDEAAGQFREVVRLRPDSAEAWNNLGNVLLLQGEPAEAIPCYRQAVRWRPTYADACLNLGNALRQDDRLDEGLAWYREAVRLRPASAKARNNLAAALLEMGEVREAETHLRDSLKFEPGSAQVLHTLAANGLYTDADPGPDQLRARLAQGGIPPLEAAQLHFVLAHLLDRAGRADEAFDHFREANRHGREVARQAGDAFDPEEHSRLVDRLMAVFTPTYFERVRGLGLDTEVPVFVVGMPRSGSSLVEQILSHHPDVAGVGELRDLPRLAASLSRRLGAAEPYPECVSRLDGATARQLAEGYLARVQGLAGAARRITDKMLENFLHLGLIATLFPRARVIHCRRDPLDTCVSCFCQMFRSLNFTWDLGDLGHYHRQYERLMAHWRAALPLPVLDVVYEELVAEPEGGSRRLVEFCDLPWDERCLRFHENPRPVRTVSKLQVRRPVYSSSVGRWRRYAAHLGPLRKALGLDQTEVGDAGSAPPWRAEKS